MYKDGKIQLGNWQKGMAISPFLGFGKIINADIYSQPGVVKCNRALTLNTPFTAFTIVGNITCECNGFIGTDAGNIYNSGGLIHGGLGFVYDMVIYKDYLVITTAVASEGIDTFGPLSTSPTYHANILNLGTTPTYGYRKMVLNNTDPVTGIWVGNENYIASISSSFNGTSDSGFNAQKFTLPNNRFCTTLYEYGDDLAIMTKYQNGSDFASIIFWDKAATYGSNIKLSESICNQMISMNNRLYYIGNDTGTLYEANKSSFTKIWSIQDRRSWQTFSNYQNAICIMQNQILFGFAPSITTNPDPVFYAVYAYQPGLGVSIRNTISTGNYGLNQTLAISSLYSASQGIYHVGWKDGSTIGFDTISIVAYAVAKIQSELMQVGTFWNTKTLSKLEANLSENLPTGSSINIEYRKSLSDDWATAKRTLSPLASGGVGRYEDSFATDDLTTVQIQITLNPGTSALTTPSLLGMLIS